MDYASAAVLFERLGEFLDHVASCFGRRIQRRGASRYLRGLLNDSDQKSIQALHGRLSDAGSYQGLQHFITHSPWEVAPVWRRLRAMLPVRRGILLLDDTSFPKQGAHSVGVARQYCGALGKTANCQVAVSTMLVAERLSWPTTLELYLPREWTDDAGRRVCWGQGTKGPLAARFVALRVRPAKSRTDCWLLCERPLTGDRKAKYSFLSAPTTWSLRHLAALAHSRWQVEQHYQELKGELGLDHFEGRSWRGWHHHAVLAALTYTFLQLERRRGTDLLPTFPMTRNLVREVVAALFFITQPQWLDLLVSFQRNPPLRI